MSHFEKLNIVKIVILPKLIYIERFIAIPNQNPRGFLRKWTTSCFYFLFGNAEDLD